MKICDITHAYTPSSGGIRTYIDAKRQYIERHTDGEHLLIIPGATDRVSREGRLTCYEVKSPLIPNCEPYRFFLRLGRLVTILRHEKPALIEFGTPYTSPWAAVIHRWQHTCALVGYYHTDFPTAYVEPVIAKVLGDFWGTPARALAVNYIRSVYNRCDAIITSSDQYYEKLAEYRIEPVHYITLGVDLETFNPRRRDPHLRQELGVAEDGFLLVYAGRFDSEKKVDVIVDAVYQLPATLPVKLVLIGEGPMKPELLRRAEMDDRLSILPFQSDKRALASLLASADVYVTAGPYETFGLSVIEAQACGLPVVGVNAGALTERVPAGIGFLGAVDSSEEMAKNILRVIHHPHRHEMGQKAREWVAARFSWDKTFRATFDLYSELVSGFQF
ncbi:MAG: glycosyltransferase family 1 protein [Gemmatimonadetes bacterium]|nr:MAG: glycosyltransferase family 1 protein [Gemmatimonadota bacterium]